MARVEVEEYLGQTGDSYAEYLRNIDDQTTLEAHRRICWHANVFHAFLLKTSQSDFPSTHDPLREVSVQGEETNGSRMTTFFVPEPELAEKGPIELGLFNYPLAHYQKPELLTPDGNRVVHVVGYTNTRETPHKTGIDLRVIDTPNPLYLAGFHFHTHSIINGLPYDERLHNELLQGKKPFDLQIADHVRVYNEMVQAGVVNWASMLPPHRGRLVDQFGTVVRATMTALFNRWTPNQ